MTKGSGKFSQRMHQKHDPFKKKIYNVDANKIKTPFLLFCTCSLLLCDLHVPVCVCVFSLHSHMALSRPWPCGPHMQRNTAGNSMNWTGLYYGTKILGSGLNSGRAKDKTGLLPWRDGQRWPLEGNFLNFTSINLSTKPHPSMGTSGNYIFQITPKNSIPLLTIPLHIYQHV